MIKRSQDRVEAVRKVVETLRGKIGAFWMAFGDYDLVGVLEMPDDVSAAAFAVAVAAGGACKDVKTIPLLGIAEGAGRRPTVAAICRVNLAHNDRSDRHSRRGADGVLWGYRAFGNSGFPRGIPVRQIARKPLCPHCQMPRAVARVFDHSKKAVFCPSRLRHQESGRKNSPGTATVRMAGPPAMARSAARKMRRARALW